MDKKIDALIFELPKLRQQIADMSKVLAYLKLKSASAPHAFRAGYLNDYRELASECRSHEQFAGEVGRILAGQIGIAMKNPQVVELSFKQRLELTRFLETLKAPLFPTMAGSLSREPINPGAWRDC